MTSMLKSLIFGLIAAATGLQSHSAANAATPVRFSACGTCTAEGVEGLILKQTNIADLVGLDLKVLFLSPPQMGAGIASNSLDIEWVGPQPTLAQLANGIDIKTVAYQFDFELRLETDKSIKAIADLKDKKIGVPFGTTAYKVASDIAAEIDLPANSIINVSPADLGTALQGGQIAGAVIWDPVWGILEKKYDTKPLERRFYTGFTNVRADFLKSDRDEVVKFVAAQMLAVVFRANNKKEVNRRYEAAFGIDADVADKAQAIDRSYGWTDIDQVDLSLVDKDFAGMEEAKAFLLKSNLIPKDIDFKASTDMTLLKDARKLLKGLKVTPSQIKYVSSEK